MTKIVLVTGKAQSGKDTTVDFLIKELTKLRVRELGEMESWNVTAKKYSFATALKNIATDLFEIPHENVWGNNDQKNQLTKVKWANLKDVMGVSEHNDWFQKVFNISPEQEYLTAREFLQFFGSEIVRKLYPNAWACRTKKDIEQEGMDYAFIADARFPNELEIFAKSPNTYVIHLTRNIIKSQHISETALDAFDFSIFGDRYFKIQNNDWEWSQKDQYLKDNILPKIMGATNG